MFYFNSKFIRRELLTNSIVINLYYDEWTLGLSLVNQKETHSPLYRLKGRSFINTVSNYPHLLLYKSINYIIKGICSIQLALILVPIFFGTQYQLKGTF